jgi:DnaD/phage-associated family protein
MCKDLIDFTGWLDTNPIEVAAQALWLHLFALWKKSGEHEWFEVKNPTLEAKLGITYKTLDKHRNTLIEKGRIEYEGTERVKGGKYRIIPLAVRSVGNIPTDRTAEAQSGGIFPTDSITDHTAERTTDPPTDRTADFSLQERKKEGKKESLKDNAHAPVENSWDTMKRLFQEIFKEPMTGNHYKFVNGYLDDEMEIEVILFAFEHAKKNKADSPFYVWRTLGAWYTEGVKTVDDYRRKIESAPAAPKKGDGPQLSLLNGGGGNSAHERLMRKLGGG